MTMKCYENTMQATELRTVISDTVIDALHYYL